MDNEKILKITSLTLTIIGMGLQLATNVISDKKLDLKIAEEVNKHIIQK